MNYGDLIKDAFRISWRNKFLWFFGFFVASSSFNVPSGGGGGGGDNDFDDFSSDPSSFAIQVGQGAFDNVALIVSLVIVALLITLVFIVLAVISTGGLADSVAAMDRGEQRRFFSTFRAGTSKFWRVLGIALLYWLIGIGIFLLILLVAGAPILLTFLLTESVAARVLVAVIFGLLGVVLLIVLNIPYRIIGQFSLRKVAVDGERVRASIGGGYQLFRRNIGRSLLVWLINVALSVGIAIATLIVLLVLLLVLVGPGVVLYIAEYATTGLVVGGVGFLLFLVPAVVIAGAVGAFSHSYWTLAYLRLTGPAERRVA